MDRTEIIQQLKAERDRLDGAISALEGSGGQGVRTSTGTKRAGAITAAGRRRLSQLMKQRWAARRNTRTTAGVHKGAAKPASQKK